MKIHILFPGILLSSCLPTARRAAFLARHAGLHTLILPHPRRGSSWFVFIGRSQIAGFIFRLFDRGL